MENIQFYNVADRVLDVYILHHRNDLELKKYDIPKSVLSKKLSVYIDNVRKSTVNKSNPYMYAYYFSNLIIHADELTHTIFYIYFTGQYAGYKVNHSKVRGQLKELGINRRGDGYRKDYLAEL